MAPGPYFPLIDPLRGFAALSVLMYHVIEIYQWRNFPDTFGLVWFKWGWMGVDIFFIISGFVITLSALNLMAKHDGNHAAAAKDFLNRRIRRIAPLFYASMALFLLLTPEIWQQSGFAKNLASHILFIHNWYPEFHRSINAPSWTLGPEFQFYIVLILLLPFVSRKNLPWIIAGALLVSFVWRACSFYLNFDGTKQSSESIFMSATQLPGMIEFFVFGMAAAHFALSRTFASVKRKLWFRMLLLGAATALGYISMHAFMAHEQDFWQLAYTVIFLRTLLALWFTCLILLLCSFEPGRFWQFLLSPFIYLGTISYGIYLIHWPVLMQIKGFTLPPALALFLTLAITAGLAALSWHFYEKLFLVGK